LSINSGASISRNPKGLSRPVAGKLYLKLFRQELKNPVSIQEVIMNVLQVRLTGVSSGENEDVIFISSFIHSNRSLSYDRSIASSKASSPQRAI
jgi:hypothetical protein